MNDFDYDRMEKLQILRILANKNDIYRDFLSEILLLEFENDLDFMNAYREKTGNDFAMCIDNFIRERESIK